MIVPFHRQNCIVANAKNIWHLIDTFDEGWFLVFGVSNAKNLVLGFEFVMLANHDKT